MFSSQDELASDLLSSRLFGLVYIFVFPRETEGEVYFLFCYIFLCTHAQTGFESMVERNIIGGGMNWEIGIEIYPLICIK